MYYHGTHIHNYTQNTVTTRVATYIENLYFAQANEFGTKDCSC